MNEISRILRVILVGSSISSGPGLFCKQNNFSSDARCPSPPFWVILCVRVSTIVFTAATNCMLYVASWCDLYSYHGITYWCRSNLLFVWNSSDFSSPSRRQTDYICELMQIWQVFGREQHRLDFHSPAGIRLGSTVIGCLRINIYSSCHTFGSSLSGWWGRGLQFLSLGILDPLFSLLERKPPEL